MSPTEAMAAAQQSEERARLLRRVVALEEQNAILQESIYTQKGAIDRLHIELAKKRGAIRRLQLKLQIRPEHAPDDEEAD